MTFPVRACALVGRFVDPRVAESVNTLLTHLKERQIQVLVSEDAVFATEVDIEDSAVNPGLNRIMSIAFSRDEAEPHDGRAGALLSITG